MNKDKVIELAKQYGALHHFSGESPQKYLLDFAAALTEPLEQRIEQHEATIKIFCVETSFCDEKILEQAKRIRELETELAHMTMAANAEAQRVNELTAEKLAVSPEVVAYLAEDGENRSVNFKESHALRECDSGATVHALGRIVPVKPMTDEEILRLSDTVRERHGWLAFVRAIEAHHGIGSKV